MGNHNHDTLWALFHKISHSAPYQQLSPQDVGKRVRSLLICGALVQIGGEQMIWTVRSDLSFDGLGDGDHSSGLSLQPRGFLITTKDSCHQSTEFGHKTEN